MTRRIILFITLIVVAISQANASGPFSRLLGSRRYSQPIQTVNPTYRGVTHSPEQMTKIYGPSILIREVAQQPKTTNKKKSRFVTQP